MKGFPFVCTVEVRFADVDAMHHVNNAVTVSYLEVARVKLWRDLFGLRGGPADFPFVVARIEIDYRRPIELGDDVEVGVAATHVGRTSFTFAYRVEAGGRLAAAASSVQVAYDYEKRVPIPVPDQLRRLLASIASPV